MINVVYALMFLSLILFFVKKLVPALSNFPFGWISIGLFFLGSLLTSLQKGDFILDAIISEIAFFSFCVAVYGFISAVKNKDKTKSIKGAIFLIVAFLLSAIPPFKENNVAQTTASEIAQTKDSTEDNHSITETKPSSSETTPKKKDLELLNLSSEVGEFARYATGQIRNNSNKTYGYVQVEINLYDENDNQVGSTLDNVNNLKPGGVWNFKAIVTEDSCKRFEVVDITGF